MLRIPKIQPIKAFLLRRNKWDNIRIFESYPNILTGCIKQPHHIKSMISSINHSQNKQYTNNQFLVVDDNENFLNSCLKEGVTTLYVNLSYERYINTGCYIYHYSNRQYMVPNLTFLPHVLHNIKLSQI